MADPRVQWGEPMMRRSTPEQDRNGRNQSFTDLVEYRGEWMTEGEASARRAFDFYWQIKYTALSKAGET